MDNMDEASKVLIESMLAEQEFYFGQTANKPSKAPKPSNCTKWSEEETEVLIDAIKIHGKDFFALSSLFGDTRTPQQIKSRIMHLIQCDRIRENDLGVLQEVEVIKEEKVILQRQEEDEEEDEIDVDDDDDDTTSKAITTPIKIVQSTEIPGKIIPTSLRHDEEDEEEIILEDDEEEVLLNPHIPNKDCKIDNLPAPALEDLPPSSPSNSLVSSEASSNEDSEDDDDKVRKKEKKTQKNKKLPAKATNIKPFKPSQADEPVNHPPPPEGFEISSTTITEYERSCNPEFFLSGTSKKYKNKTPDRYILIRNYIIQEWNRRRPRYLMKSTVRKGLIGNGDVYAIDRVWGFLVSCGKINVESELFVDTKKKDYSGSKKKKTSEGFGKSIASIMDYTKRLRRVRDEDGEWINEKDLEGKVIDHDVLALEDHIQEEKLANAKRRKLFFQKGARPSWEYDPFTLVPLNSFPNGEEPFTVDFGSDAMLVMDFHSHLAHTEVIGLLGGVFDTTTKTIKVHLCFPCRSTSTEVQCEMDPVSEMQARTLFASQNLSVVGWYHSHPTFTPNPSIRDIENQSAYQSLFKSGDMEPFIGVIFNPYNNEYKSHIQVLYIGPEWEPGMKYRLPYKLNPIINRLDLNDDVYTQLSDLAEQYKVYEYKVDLQDHFGPEGKTRLDKLINAVGEWSLEDKIEGIGEKIKSFIK